MAIRFVHGDTAPQLKLTISDSVAGSELSLTNYNINMYVRVAGTTPATPILIKTTAGGGIVKSNQTTFPGECVVSWVAGDLNLTAGSYEAEIELIGMTGTVAAGIVETIYDLVSFSVRAEMGPSAAGALG
jgi:hypothetical protein